jgi:hypothetical protein
LYAAPPVQQAAPRLLLHACALSLPASDDAQALHCRSAVPF